MERYTSLLRIAAVIIVVLALGALFGWYYFLQGKNSQTNAENAGAGYGTAAPVFVGSTGSSYANVVSTLGEQAGVTSTSSTSRLWEVSEVPVAGFGWQSSSSPSLYFVERSSGYVFDAQTQARAVTRLTDTLRPKIYEASVSLDGSVLERSVDDTGALITFAGAVASSTPDVQVTGSSTSATAADLIGSDLPTGIGAIAVDPQYDTLFYTIPGASGVSLVSTNFAGEKEKSLFSSAIDGWRLFAPGDGSVVMLQAPLDGVEGYAYQLQKGGSFSLIAQAPGLTVLPRASSTTLIFGSSSNGALALFAQSSSTATPEQLSIQTVADKCAWAPASPGVSKGVVGNLIAYCGVPETTPSQQFLDDWYKGLVHTSDKFYEVDVSAASTTLLYDPSGDTNAQLDVEDASVDPTGQYLAFINAKDQSLWVLRIAQ
jgi:hypothetical protein